ncbi:MAG: hypothetical protein ABSD80_12890 [Caulobacteraceae bacterium]
MDRARAARLLTLAAGLGLLAAAGETELKARLHPARWLAPGADAPRALSTSFTECLVRPADAKEAYLVELGRSAFRTPMLLGGQAARAGLACESCHQAGRRNPDFYFPGLSGAPGTADVTSALFSSHRDDGIDNPKPIPDLSSPKSALKVSQDPARGDLERFIHGLVTEEFDGAEPPPAVLTGLAAYVRALGPGACPAQARASVRAADFVDEARRSVRAAQAALTHGDSSAALLMIDGARWRLGLISERYDDPGSADARAALKAADLDLLAAQDAIRAGDKGAEARLSLLLARSEAWAPILAREEKRSLFDPGRLEAEARGR